MIQSAELFSGGLVGTVEHIYIMSKVYYAFYIYFLANSKGEAVSIHTRTTYAKIVILSTTVVATLPEKRLDLNRKKSTFKSTH